MTSLAQFKTSILAQLGIPGEADNLDDLLTFWLNEAYTDLVRRTQCNVLTTSLELTEDVTDYTLPSGALAILTWQNADTGQTIEMIPVNLPTIRQLQATSATSAVSRYAIRGNMLSIYPVPADGGTLNVDYVPRPTDMSVPTDEPDDVPSEHHEMIEWKVLSKLAMQREHKASENGQFWLALYREGIRDMKAAQIKRGGIRQPRATVGSGRFVPHDPSTDIF